MLKSIHSQSGSHEIAGGNIPVMSFNKASPAHVVTQVAGGCAVETAYPFLQATIVGIDVLDVTNTRDDAMTSGQIDWPMCDPHLSGDGSQGLCTIGTQNDISRQKRLERSTNVLLVGFFQHKIYGVLRPISANQGRRLLFGSAAFTRFAAPFAGSPRKPFPSAFLRLKEVGFVYLNDPCQAHRLLAIGQLQEPVAPTGNPRVRAMRTDGLRGDSGFHQVVGCSHLHDRLQAIHQPLPLVRRQPLHRTQQFPEILEAHRNTYLQ